MVRVLSGCVLSGNNNLTSQDPLLLPLVFNGGLTRTHALAGNSPAVDTGINPVPFATD